jgi:hypothetical protein
MSLILLVVSVRVLAAVKWNFYERGIRELINWPATVHIGKLSSEMIVRVSIGQ